MQLLQFFLNRSPVLPLGEADDNQDPLQHPDLARMSLRELADLPIGDHARPRPKDNMPALRECA